MEKEIGNKIFSFLSQLDSCIDVDSLLIEIECDLVYNLEQFTSHLLKNGHIDPSKWIYQLCYSKINNKSIIFALSYSKFLNIYCDEHIKALEVINYFLINPNKYSKSHYYGLLCENSDNIKGCICDQWHFKMLNDKSRNLTYQNSIIKSIKHIELLNNKLGHNNKIIRVLDIGSGSGLLGIYAAKVSSNVQVYCCELNIELSNISKQIIQDNNVQNQITIISKHSTDLIIGNSRDDIPCKVDLILTELLDAGLLGISIFIINSLLSHF
jgi:SAM-dependent methyltransferase